MQQAMATMIVPLYVILFIFTEIVYGNTDANTIFFSSWTSVEIQDRNVLKSKAISENTGDGIWILGGILDNGQISDSISFIDTTNYDTTTFSDYLNPEKVILPSPIYCNHQCSTKLNGHDIVIVSPSNDNNVIYELWIFHPLHINITTYVRCNDYIFCLYPIHE